MNILKANIFKTRWMGRAFRNPRLRACRVLKQITTYVYEFIHKVGIYVCPVISFTGT
jgi:hypothetical protein